MNAFTRTAQKPRGTFNYQRISLIWKCPANRNPPSGKDAGCQLFRTATEDNPPLSHLGKQSGVRALRTAFHRKGWRFWSKWTVALRANRARRIKCYGPELDQDCGGNKHFRVRTSGACGTVDRRIRPSIAHLAQLLSELFIARPDGVQERRAGFLLH